MNLRFSYFFASGGGFHQHNKYHSTKFGTGSVFDLCHAGTELYTGSYHNPYDRLSRSHSWRFDEFQFVRISCVQS